MPSATIGLPLGLVVLLFAVGVGFLISSGVTATSADAFGIVSLALGLLALYFARHTDQGVGRIETRQVRDTFKNLEKRIEGNEFDDALPEMTAELQAIGRLARDADRSVLETVVLESVVPAVQYAIANAPASVLRLQVWDVVRAAKDLGVEEAELDELAEQIGGRWELVEGDHGAFAVSESDAALRALTDLAARYNQIRATQRPGVKRTSEMTAIVQQIEDAAKRTNAFNWQSALTSEDRGMRLAAYAYLYVRPQRGAGEPLVQTLLHLEDKPFGQYWALQALRKVAAVDDSLANFLPQLRGYEQTLAPGTDRARESCAVIELIEAKAQHRV